MEAFYTILIVVAFLAVGAMALLALAKLLAGQR
jgi:hypothetical protein